MVEFDIVLRDIRLRVLCESYKKGLICDLMKGHSYIEEPKGIATYYLVLSDEELLKKKGIYFNKVDKWYDNASCDIWIDNPNRVVYMGNIKASEKYRDKVIQYFTCNLFNRLIEEKGYIAFHSSAVEKDGEGLAFIGARNAGKTNCMLNMMSGGFNSITNDKLAMQFDGHNLNGYGVAQDVSIRMDLGFRSQERNKKYLPFAEREGLVFSDENKLEGNNIHLSSTELAELNGVLQVPETKIRHIIFPRYDSSVTEAIVRPMDKDKAREIILSQRLPIVHDTNRFLNVVNTRRVAAYGEQDILDEMERLENYEVIQGEKSADSFVKKLTKIYRG